MSRKVAVLNEVAQVEDILKRGFTQNIFNYTDISLLAKKFVNDGLDKNQVKNNILKFCLKWDNSFNIVMHETTIDRAIKNGFDFDLKNTLGINIPVYKKEIEKIKKLPYDLYRVCFVMLVLSRYNKFTTVRRVETKKKRTGTYYANYNFMDIINMSGLSNNLGRKEINRIKYELDGKRGLISSYEFDEKVWKVLFAGDGDGDDVVALVRDMEHIIDFIPTYCLDCGNSFKMTGKRNRCDSCYSKYLRIKKTETMRNLRK